MFYTHGCWDSEQRPVKRKFEASDALLEGRFG